MTNEKERRKYLRESIEIKEAGLSLEEQNIKYAEVRVEAERGRILAAEDKIRFHGVKRDAAPKVIKRLTASIQSDKDELGRLNERVKAVKLDDVKMRALGLFGKAMVEVEVMRVLIGLTDGSIGVKGGVEALDGIDEKLRRAGLK